MISLLNWIFSMLTGQSIALDFSNLVLGLSTLDIIMVLLWIVGALAVGYLMHFMLKWVCG